jgi:hypothetical protein
MGPYVANLAAWRLFPTLTYDTRRLLRAKTTLPPQTGAVGRPRPRALREGAPRLVGFGALRRDLDGYVRDLQSRLRQPLLAVFAVERHKSGALHVHGLIAPVRGREWFSGLLDDAIVATQAWYAKHGYARVVNIAGDKDEAAIAAYCAKYATKDEGLLIFIGQFQRVASGASGGERHSKLSGR